MHLYIDNREPTELIELIKQLNNNNYLTIFIKTLNIGDFILYDEKKKTNLLIIERKSLTDMEASIKDGRYKEQSYRLTQMNLPNHNIYYLLEGNLLTYKNNKLIYSCLTSLSYFKGFSILNSLNTAGTAQLIYNLAYKIYKEETKLPFYISYDLQNYNNKNFININTNDLNKNLENDKIENDKTENDKIENDKTENDKTENDKTENDKIENDKTENDKIENDLNKNLENDKEYCNVIKTVKKSNITRDNISSIMLMQIPGISNQTAIAIMNKYENIVNLINNLKINNNCLDNIKLESNRKISKSAIKSIKEYLI